MEQIKLVNAKSAEVYRYMNFDQIPEFVEQAATVEMQVAKIGRNFRLTVEIPLPGNWQGNLFIYGLSLR